MAFQSDSNLKDIKKLKKDLNTLTDNLIFTAGINESTPSFANSGGRNASGGIHTGPDVVQPLTHIITDVNDSGVSTGIFDKINIMSSNVVIDQAGVIDMTLKYIQKTANNGQRISALTVTAGKTLTLKAGGDLDILSDIVMTDSDLAYLVYSEDISDKYRVLSTCSPKFEGDYATWSLDHSIISEDGTPGNNFNNFGVSESDDVFYFSWSEGGNAFQRRQLYKLSTGTLISDTGLQAVRIVQWNLPLQANNLTMSIFGRYQILTSEPVEDHQEVWNAGVKVFDFPVISDLSNNLISPSGKWIMIFRLPNGFGNPGWIWEFYKGSSSLKKITVSDALSTTEGASHS